MTISGFPTSSDIYLEIKGKKVAVVQSYTARTTRESGTIEAFGQEQPVATIPGKTKHIIELTRLYATDSAVEDGIHFYDLEDFDVVICKPKRKIVYSHCQWSSISEVGALGAMVVEKITVIATKRMETAAN
ncbi:MAG: hypothetical protein RR226_03745 [Oscillospiraceae bacterium]